MSKRVVFLDGDVAVICGHTDGELPVTISIPFEIRGRQVEFASLIKVTTRAAFYKEPMTPRSYGSMSPAQR